MKNKQILFVLVLIIALIFESRGKELKINPNPIYGIVSEDIEEPYNIFSDSSFENESSYVRVISSGTEIESSSNYLIRTENTAYDGQWCYKIMNPGNSFIEVSFYADPDKAEDIIFSCWVKTEQQNQTIRQMISFENMSLVEGPVFGEETTISSEWQKTTLTTSTTSGFLFAFFGIEVPPLCTLYVDLMKVEIPVWKHPLVTGHEIGGVIVPPEPAAPVHLNFSIHIEDPQNLVEDEEFFYKKTAVFTELAKLFHQYGGFLNIQPELEWILGIERFAPNTLKELADQYDITLSTHTHGPNCKDENGIPYGAAYCKANSNLASTEITETDIANYLEIRRTKFEEVSGISVTDHNGNFDAIEKDSWFDRGFRTLSVFKNKYYQKSYDYHIINPWRPTECDGLEEIENFLTHNPEGKLIYIPGLGSNITKRHQRVPMKAKRIIGQFLQYADSTRINSMNLIFHVDAFTAQNIETIGDEEYIDVSLTSGEPQIIYSQEFLEHLGYWEELLKNTIQPLTEAGYLTWSTHEEIADKFEAWEIENVVSEITDSIVHIPSESGGETGIAMKIRLPETPRYSGYAPVVLHIKGGFDGAGINLDVIDLSELGFIECFFNFPGSGLGEEKSGGTYDTRGLQSLTAIKDLLRFVQGKFNDLNNKPFTFYLGNVIPLQDNIGMVGWSNGGNAALCAAGIFADEIDPVGWIVNYESPVGDGMPTTEAGSQGHEQNPNPETNSAYHPDTGEWDMTKLKIANRIDINQNHAGGIDEPIVGGYYFDIDDNGTITPEIDFVPYPIAIANDSMILTYYSERITSYAESQGMIENSSLTHLTSSAQAQEFWYYRNGEKWISELVAKHPDIKFIVCAFEQDHAQTALDHPHVLIQYQGFLENNAAFVRLNPDQCYLEYVLELDDVNSVDNPAFENYDHQSIRQAVQTRQGPVSSQSSIAAACCELADRTFYSNLEPQLDETLTEHVNITEKNEKNIKKIDMICYPNPAQSFVTICYYINNRTDVTLTIFDLLGRKINSFVNEEKNAGNYKINLQLDHYTNGIYFIKLTTKETTLTQKILFVK